jgi:kynurenine formamidase
VVRQTASNGHFKQAVMKLFLEDGRYFLTEKPLDLSIPIQSNHQGVRAWYVNHPSFEPVRENGFLGSVSEGGQVNFRSVTFNPHGNGTHTECLGHITSEVFSINQHLKEYMSLARLVSVEPKQQWNETYQQYDACITPDLIDTSTWNDNMGALVIRTIPNDSARRTLNYSDTNPPYLHADVMHLVERFGIQHLLIDLPSVDRERDGGELAFHHLFWGVPDDLHKERTITELIYVSDEMEDGEYLLELQVAAFENDAAPSRPVLYQLYESI